MFAMQPRVAGYGKVEKEGRVDMKYIECVVCHKGKDLVEDDYQGPGTCRDCRTKQLEMKIADVDPYELHIEGLEAQLIHSQGRIAELSAVVALVLDEVRTARNPMVPLDVKVNALERAYELLREHQPTTGTGEEE